MSMSWIRATTVSMSFNGKGPFIRAWGRGVAMFRTRRQMGRTSVLIVGFMALVMNFVVLSTTAGGAVTHQYLPEVSKKISEGVPAGCGGRPAPGCVSGPLSGVQAKTVESGHVWVPEQGQNGSWNAG